jgi:hypothetical protein
LFGVALGYFIFTESGRKMASEFSNKGGSLVNGYLDGMVGLPVSLVMNGINEVVRKGDCNGNKRDYEESGRESCK